jgi:hypothetical protein
MRSGLAVAVVITYLLGFAGLFAWMWEHGSTDDYAGWSPTIVALSLPSALAIAAGPVRTRHWHAAAVALPAGLAIGCAALGVTLRVCTWLMPGDLAGLLVMMLMGPVFAGVFAAVVWRYLLRWPLRVGAAHVLGLVAVAGSVSLLVLAPLWWGLWREADALEQAVTVATLLFGLLPLAWTIGPALALWLGRRAA